MNRAATWSRQPLAELTRSLTNRGPVDGVTFTLVPPLVE
jgi:hypothetical protein